jgi:hypothetical protein
MELRTGRRTIPTVNGELIDALSSAGGAGVIEVLAGHLDGGDGWIHRRNGRIEWYPHHQRLVLSARPGAEGDTVRLDAVLATGADRTRDLLEALDELNRRAAGWWLWHNDITDEVVLSASFTADTTQWWWAAAASTTILLAACVTDTQSGRLALLSGGTPAVAEHPTRGRRDEPDAWLNGAGAVAREPGAGLGVWVTATEERELLAAVPGAEPIGAGFGAALTTEHGATLAVQGAWHPELGAGVQWLTHLPVNVSPTRSIEIAARLNTNAGCDPSSPARQSGWHSTPGGIADTLFLPASVIEQLQDLSGIEFGPTAASMLDTGRRLRDAAHATQLLTTARAPGHTADGTSDLDRDEPEHGSGNTSAVGVGMTPGGSLNALAQYAEPCSTAQFCSDWDELLDAVDTGLRGARRGVITPPLLLPNSTWGTPRRRQLACWGYFNPVGPSIGTLETIERGTTDGATVTYLVHSERHPHSPRLSIVAVADGPDTLDALIPAVLTNPDTSVLTHGPPGWLAVHHHTSSVHAGFTAYARQLPGEELEQDRNDLLYYAGDPWRRAGETARQLLRARPARRTPGRGRKARGDLAADWVAALSNPAVVDGYVAYLRSAWEAARTLVGENWDWHRAQHVAASLRARAARRIRHDRG